MSNDNDNIFSIVKSDGGPPTAPEDTIPQNTYLVTDILGEEFQSVGFLLFTSHHVAVMRDTPAGALPVLVLPLDRVHSAELLEDDEESPPF